MKSCGEASLCAEETLLKNQIIISDNLVNCDVIFMKLSGTGQSRGRGAPPSVWLVRGGWRGRQ